MWAQHPSVGIIRGVIIGPRGDAVADARLRLNDAQGAVLQETRSDPDGDFRFTTLEPGTYELKVEAAGFQPVQRPDVSVKEGGSVYIELQLMPDASSVADAFRLRDSVEVTATRSTLGTEVSPASSTVVLRNEFERRNIVAVDQALAAVEGVYSYRQRGVPDNEVGIGMRGFSGRGTGQSRVLILQDGQPINNAYTGGVNWTGLPLSEVDRIEVVRGPFSSLYGGNAMGGVVNVITRPIDRRTVEAAAQYGTYGTLNYSGRVGSKVGDRLGLSFGFDSLSTDGYRAQDVLRTATNSTPDGGVPVVGVERFLTRTGTVNYGVGFRGPNTYERYGLRGRAEYAFGSNAFGSFQYQRQSNEYGWGDYQSNLRDAEGRAIDNGRVVFQEGDVWRRITLSPSNFLGFVGGGSSNLYQGQLLLGSSRSGYWRFQGGVNDLPRDWSAGPGATATQAGGPGTETVQANRGAFGNVQWSHNVRSNHNLTVGVDTRFDQASISVFPTTEYLGGGMLSERNTFTQGKATTWAVYGQDQFVVSDRLVLNYGGRYDSWRTYDGQSQPAAGQPTGAFEDRSAGALTGKLAAVLTLRPGSALRANVASAFRNPSVFDLYRDLQLSSGTLLIGNPDLDPERMASWEAGFRQDFGQRVSADAAYYENRISDLIFRSLDLAADPTGFTRRMLNAGRARTRGVELALTARPWRWLTARPTYTYTDAIITRNDLSPGTVGSQIPFVPRHVAAGTLTAALKRLTVTGTARYQSAVFSTDTNTDTTKGVPGAYDEFFETDASVNYQVTRRLTASLAAENLFNRRYFLFYRNPGRMVYVGLRYRWSGGVR